MINQKYFNFIMASAVLLVLAIPVGIANFYLGYVVGEGPCTLCWQERIGMVVTGVAGILMLRYGLKLKYIAMAVISGGYGMFMTLRHTSFMSSRDMGMGFGGDIFGAHTYTWGVLVYWVVIIFMGLILLFVKNSDFKQDLIEQSEPKSLSLYSKVVIWLSFIVVLSNAFQALVQAGLPPYVGKGTPERFSISHNTWVDGFWDKFKKPFSFVGSNVVKEPFIAGLNEDAGISFSDESKNGAFVQLDEGLKIQNVVKLDFAAVGIFGKGVASGIAYNKKAGNFAICNTHGGVYFLDSNLNKASYAIIDMPNGRNLKYLADCDFDDETLIITGINKTLTAIKLESKDKINAYASWVSMREASDNVMMPWKQDRPYILSVRAKKHYVLSLAKDTQRPAMYMIAVPNDKYKKQILIEFSTKDRLLNSEKQIHTKLALKPERNVNDYYITAMTMVGADIIAYSKNYNTLLKIDPNSAEITKAFKMPLKSEIGEIVSLSFDGESLYFLSKKDGQNLIIKAGL